MQGFTTVAEMERFLLEHGEQVVDILGSEVDRIEARIKVGGVSVITLYPSRPSVTYICVMSFRKPYMGSLILGVNTLYRLFCFFKLFLMAGRWKLVLKRNSYIYGKERAFFRMSPN